MLRTSKLASRRRSLPTFSSASAQTPTSNPSPSPSFASILQQIKNPHALPQAHAGLITSGLAHNVFLSNGLMNCYCSFGLTADAELVFRRMPRKNVFSWTILVSGFCHNGLYVEGLRVFWEMNGAHVVPNAVTVVSVLPACIHLGLTVIGRSMHGFLIRRQIEGNLHAGSSLVHFYAKCGDVRAARFLFEKMLVKNVVSWNLIISGYSENGFGEEGLCLFKRMRRDGFRADFVTIMNLLSACSVVGCFSVNSMIHGFVTKCGFENDKLVQTAIMDMNVKCGHVKDAYQIFREKKVMDVVSWTLMISSFSDIGYGNKAMELFYEMMMSGDVVLDSVALIGVLSGCSRLGALKQGRRVHGLVTKMGFADDIYVGTALIHMYTNCGSLESARSFFDGMVKRDVVSWNAMIAGNGMNGHGADAIQLFLRMERSGLKPDEATYVSVLWACSHAGLVDQGIEIFNSMVKESDVVSNSQHYACMVDILARTGRLDDAYLLICNMPFQADADVYGTLLGACRNQGNIGLGREISEKLLKLDVQDPGFFVLLANMYALAGNWDGVRMTRVSLRSKGLRKDPGFSSIEIDRKIHTFVAGDKDHPQYHEIYEMLKALIAKIELEGWVPDTNFVLQDVTEDIKQDMLYHRSEKLEIACGNSTYGGSKKLDSGPKIGTDVDFCSQKRLE
ncbi:hypothetical protein ACLOJK_002995 [Asimina triloba]